MPWLGAALETLSRRPVIGYNDSGAPGTEPTALAALALAAHGRSDAASAAASFLLHLQSEDGSVGIRQGHASPGWATSLAIMAWSRCAEQGRFHEASERAVAWLLDSKGIPLPPDPDRGHDGRLIGWSWAARTHSWLEPTAFAVIGLRMAGRREHQRIREGVALLLDRQLAGGGCNYGNTTVFGTALRAHVEPTGIALVALAGEPDAGGRTAKSVEWLESNVGSSTAALSLGWALLGLRAQGRAVGQAREWLAAAADRVNRRDRAPHRLAVLALAAAGWPA